MAKILILGGGFGGVVAAEALAKLDEHEITLVSRSRKFLFYPALVRLAFGKCDPDDVSFDLRESMLSRRVNFIEAEVARIDPETRHAILAHGDVAGSVTYDYLIFALGRRLATERVSGFFEHAHHLLDLDGALKFGEALRDFSGGRIVAGECLDARLPVPVYETALALAQWTREDGPPNTTITIVDPASLESELHEPSLAKALMDTFAKHRIEYVANFPITNITAKTIGAADKRQLDYDLLMLLPPFTGSSAASHLGITNEDGYINVDWTMKVIGVERMYAIGDCVNFNGPKMGHMAVNQAEVAAANLASEISGRDPVAHYRHDLMMVVEGDSESIYFHKDLWADQPAKLHRGIFWSWAKRIHEKFWETTHE